MNFEIYFEIEEFEADKPFYYIKGGSKVRLSKNVFRTFHNILIKICISFLVEMRFSILVHCGAQKQVAALWRHHHNL